MIYLPSDFASNQWFEAVAVEAFKAWRTVQRSARADLPATPSKQAQPAPMVAPAPVSKIALLETQVEQLTRDSAQLKEEHKLMKMALEIANKDNAEKEETIREKRAGTDVVRDRIALALDALQEVCTGRGLLADLDLVIAKCTEHRTPTAPPDLGELARWKKRALTAEASYRQLSQGVPVDQQDQSIEVQIAPTG